MKKKKDADDDPVEERRAQHGRRLRVAQHAAFGHYVRARTPTSASSVSPAQIRPFFSAGDMSSTGIFSASPS
jgi:hypothetical protein